MTQRALITGANRGLGLATSKALSDLGVEVIMTGRNEAQLTQAKASIDANSQLLHTHIMDVSSDDSVQACISKVLKNHGPIHILINNAGAILEKEHVTEKPSSSTSHDSDVLLKALNINTLGAYRTIQALLPSMVTQTCANIVNVSSGMGALNDMGKGWPAYRISKTALNALTKIIHNDTPSHVNVNAVCPGWVRTDMGGEHATRSLEEGIKGIVWAAMLDEDGPSGGFFRDGQPIDW